MKLAVYVIWNEGGASYGIKDQETGTPGAVDIVFTSESEAQAYLDTHRKEIEHKGLPHLSPESSEDDWQLFDLLAKRLDEDAWVESHFGMRQFEVAKRFLLRLASEPNPPDEFSLRRIESVIARLDFMADNARAKLTPEAREPETKLWLAQNYFERGDKKGALEVLNELLRQGDDEYKNRARKMTFDISGAANSPIYDLNGGSK